MRWLRNLKDRGVSARDDEKRENRFARDADDPGVIFVYSAFGWYYMEQNSDPMEAPGFAMKVA
jgi:hypothetical protein